MYLAAEDTGKAGPLGFLIIILLIIASYFLFKSMSKHLRRVREEFPDADGGPYTAPAEPSDNSPAGTDAADPITDADESATGPTRERPDRQDHPAG